jgi:hypothetical protein
MQFGFAWSGTHFTQRFPGLIPGFRGGSTSNSAQAMQVLRPKAQDGAEALTASAAVTSTKLRAKAASTKTNVDRALIGILPDLGRSASRSLLAAKQKGRR